MMYLARKYSTGDFLDIKVRRVQSAGGLQAIKGVPSSQIQHRQLFAFKVSLQVWVGQNCVFMRRIYDCLFINRLYDCI